MITASHDRKCMVEKNFSKYAHIYDRYAGIQRHAAYELIGKEYGNHFKSVLEIGCGTGHYTSLLREKFTGARIKALDISRKMIELARIKLAREDIEFEIADAEESSPERGFDLITSNAAFQWFDDPEIGIKKYMSVLESEGIMLFSIFGPLTFCELNGSLKAVLGQRVKAVSDNFPDKGKLETILKRHSRKSVVTEEAVTKEYQTLMELLYEIKYTGTRGNGMDGLLSWSKGKLREVEEKYISNFGSIRATYQIFYCRAVK